MHIYNHGVEKALLRFFYLFGSVLRVDYVILGLIIFFDLVSLKIKELITIANVCTRNLYILASLSSLAANCKLQNRKCSPKSKL